MTAHILGGLLVIGVSMAAEAVVSSRHEQALLRRGATEPAGDVYPLMRVAYPLSFVTLALDGWYRGAPGPAWIAAGVGLFALAKVLKYAAIAALGERWTFKVLVLPGVPLVRVGPYRWMDHPNYLAVLGELAGAACYFGAALAGPLAFVGFGWLIVRRLAVERAALGAGASKPAR